jgi:hypothetical protein
MSSKFTSYCVVFLFGGFLVSSACSSSSNPAGPSDASSSSSGSGSVRVTVNPNPVPFSGKRITDVAGCAQRNNTWFYELIIEETGGSAVTFHSQIDAFDGFIVNNLTGLKISVPANGKVTLSPRWCSATNEKHTALHTFTGNDSKGNTITLETPTVNLMKND